MMKQVAEEALFSILKVDSIIAVLKSMAEAEREGWEARKERNRARIVLATMDTDTPSANVVNYHINKGDWQEQMGIRISPVNMIDGVSIWGNIW